MSPKLRKKLWGPGQAVDRVMATAARMDWAWRQDPGVLRGENLQEYKRDQARARRQLARVIRQIEEEARRQA
jgi:hypothetical protein